MTDEEFYRCPGCGWEGPEEETELEDLAPEEDEFDEGYCLVCPDCWLRVEEVEL